MPAPIRIVTTNLPLSDWTQVLPNPRLCKALLDRFTDRALRRDVEMPTIESIKRFVQMGMGVAIVPRMCVRWEVEREQLAEVRIRQLKMSRSLYLVSRRGARLLHAALGLMRLLHA
jgi:DNA-binding transcriptional LysR family regulator